jgi:hypothetical protein
MQGISESVDRRQRMEEARRTAVDGETITNNEMMNIWGVTKGRWTDIRNRIPDFPVPVTNGNVQFYPRVAALDRMWAHETRGDQVAATKAKRVAALLGVEQPDGAMPSLSDMQRASALRAEIETRMIAQGELVPRAQVRRLSSQIGEFLSRRLSSLGSVLDPNGKWSPEMREAADKAGQDWLLRMYADLRHMLEPDADAQPPDAGEDRGRSAKSRAPRARRVGGSGVAGRA